MEGQTFSHYRVVAHLGGGGMGVVYKAEDVRLKRTVALKFLPHEMTRDPEARERFIQEAQAASALDHPNICTIYDVDKADDGQLFIAMAYYDGETLKQRLKRGPLPVADALDIAIQIGRGLENAHHAGIIHRDIKPANIMLAHDGLVKIVDFGIAKLVDHTGPTRTGTTLGTVGYMAPEQVRGSGADLRVDVWALGVVLYEMIAGAAPFLGQNDAAIINNILTQDPPPVAGVRSDVDRVLRRALAKSPEQRYATAADLVRDLSECVDAITGRHAAPVPAARPTSQRALIAALVLVLAMVGAAGGWWLKRSADSRRLDGLVADATALGAKDQYVAALALVEQAEHLAPEDPRLATLSGQLSITRTIKTEPPGAQVSVKDYSAVSDDWAILGNTPIVDRRLPRAMMRWKVVKEGFEPMEFVSPTPVIPPAGMQLRLAPAGSVPPGMVRVALPRLSMTLFGYDYTRFIPAGAFLIDKYEVTNKQFKAFVDAGGYTKREYWKEPFIRDGRTISWEEAVATFRDRTGRPGPSAWEVGTFPAGRDNDPVGGVSWYEAAAYAVFVGKSLPTTYHWLGAATSAAAAYITPFSNYDGKGPAAVGSHPAVTGTGAFDMAGNVKEWCWNETGPNGDRYILGGSWIDPPHTFGYADARPALDRAEVNGFRLAKYLGDQPLDPALTAAIPAPVRDFSKEHPVSDQVFAAYRSLYAYDPRPLDEKSESKDDSAAQWTVEKVSFTAGYGTDRVWAFVFVPKGGHPPYQTVVYAPGAFAIAQRRSTNQAPPAIDFLLLSGRAVIFPLYQGTYERTNGRTSPWPERTRAYQDWMVQVVQDARRAVDYIATRSDLKQDNVAYYGNSWGAMFGSIVLAVEPRLRVGVFTDGGLTASTEKPPEVDQFNFAPHVSVPVLMVNGDSDYIYQVETAQKPLFNLLGTSPDRKRHVVFHSGHGVLGPQRSQVVKEILDWLDKYLGPVAGGG
jgi:eukaryotic-like serine/threonine-protein kinase